MISTPTARAYATSVHGRRLLPAFVEERRAQALRNQAAAWEEARALRTYLDALEVKYGGAPESAEWIAWVRRYVDERLDPLASPPLMPAEPEIRPDDLKPFLGGLSPHGPSRG
jgi:hypothetical protein